MQEASNLKVFGFAAIITIVCAVVLGLAATGLKELHDINAEVDMKSKVLSAIGEDISQLTNQDMLDYFSEKGFKKKRVKQIFFNNEGEMVSVPEDEQKRLTPEKMSKQNLSTLGYYPIYLYYATTKSQKPDAYVMPVFGKGLWSICYGFLALDSDASTVKALVYYQHGETPGLGAEIADNQEWVQQFTKGKKILDENGKLKPLKSSRLPEVRQQPKNYPSNFWHISGATFTVDGVNKMLTDFLMIYDKYLSKQRGL